MSGVAVVFHRDGSPVAPSELEVMTAAMAHRAVDGTRHELDGPIGVGFCSMATTPEAVRERQPLRHGSTILAMDGRLDDRASLRAALGGTVLVGTGDAELALLAVERWGDRFVNHLIGDFAIVVADPARRRVLCARDHLGVKPLYYASSGRVFVAASEVKAVLAHPAVSDELDPAGFETFVREHWTIPNSTIYRSVAPLPMASTLVVGVEGLRGPVRYWAPSCAPDEQRSRQDVLDEYRWLLDAAIGDRLRAAGPIVVAMSGGLDSTSVAASATALAHAAPDRPEVRVASLVFPGHPLIDESSQIAAMEQRLGMPVRRVRPRARGPSELVAEIREYRELPDMPNDLFSFLVRPSLGERVLLTGLGGDDWFYGPAGLELTLAARRGRLDTALRLARWGRAEGRYSSARRSLWQFGLRPLLRLPCVAAARWPLCSSALTRFGGRFGQRALQVGWCPPGVPLDTAPMLSWSRDARLGSRLTGIERRAARRGFEHRHPLHDLRLVEFALRLPAHFRSQNLDSRWLPRQAMAGRLPDEVRLRREKAEFSLMVREEVALADQAGLLRDVISAAREPGKVRDDWLRIQATPPDQWHHRLPYLWSLLVVHLADELPL